MQSKSEWDDNDKLTGDIKMTTELIKTSPQTVQEIRNMPSNQLEEFAENKSKEILILIQKSIEKVSDAKRDAEEANNMKSGFLFGRTTKKADAASAALLRTNEAVAELAKLQKEAITFTCISIFDILSAFYITK